MAEEDLPEELNKLEIAPSLPQIKLVDTHLPVTLNPFFDEGIDEKVSLSADAQYKVLFEATNIETAEAYRQRAQSCRKCRYRRRSESVLDDFKSTSTNTEDLRAARTTLKVNKQSLKKTSGGRKVVLHEPILRALQTCFHIQSTARRKVMSSVAPTAEQITLASTVNDPSYSGEISSFNDLRNECQTMLQENVDFSSSLSCLSLSRRSSKKFTTMQAPNLRTKTKKSPNGSLRNSIIPSLLSSTENSFTSRANTSCSLQAASSNQCSHSNAQGVANSGSGCTPDDVTINELASYFETLVHIPKKMSSMAEMMYI